MWTDSIQKIVVINTNDGIGKERLPLVTKELNRYDIDFDVYPAIKNENGELGLMLTMRKLFTEALNFKLENILVFEDDCQIIDEDFNKIMEAAMQQLPKDFLYLALGYNLLLTPEKVSDNILKIKSAYSTHSIIYTKRCMEMILEKWDEEKPFDNFLLHNIQPFGSSYGVYPILTSQRTGVSNIFKYNPEKQIGIERYYNVETKEINWGLMMQERYNELTKNI